MKDLAVLLKTLGCQPGVVIATYCKKSLFFEVCSPGASPLASIAGLMRCNGIVNLAG
jgi:hypothetical protein